MIFFIQSIISGPNEGSVSRELSELPSPNDMKEKLIRLEHENKLLRQNQGTSADQASVQVCFIPVACLFVGRLTLFYFIVNNILTHIGQR